MASPSGAPNPDQPHPDPVEMARAMSEIAERSRKLVGDFMRRQADERAFRTADPFNVGQAFMDMTARMMADPAKLAQAQMALWRDYAELWQRSAQRMMTGEAAEPVIEPARSDKRFKDAAWDENAVFDYIKQSYLLSARWMQSTVREVDGLDDKTARKLDFYTRQFVDAMAPSNFAMTNPEVVRATMESGGENLVRGLENLLDDLERGKGKLAIRMTDTDAFRVGDNIAVTPGKVVYENDLMQLIQYAPATETVARRPLLIIPPWINKYYILDLKPKNSFIKWAVEQGLTVFVVSWVNPGEELAAKTFEDYMIEGLLAALDAVEKATGESEINVIGYCLGGTLLSATLAWMTARGDDRIKSATYFTTMVDFAEAGELGVFIDEEQLDALESKMRKKGYLEGDAMATTFNMLRANDLIWSFVINNYLLGKDPFPFDLLYWNSDSTRMPAAMHSFYLRNMYQRNLLARPGGITLGGVPIDLTTVKVPAFILSTREDHIAPWKSTYAATQLYAGPVKFCLAGSGHIAGVVNPPAAGKYAYWTNARKPKSPDAWLKAAKEASGSWWPEWRKWLSKFDGGSVPARVPGDGGLKVIEDAPGRYVAVRGV
ncbi:class I poly(R)-hydroxyalkanoic acid synthase [Inquilinus sp. CAU 1745]|uniref:PHA/PHB synthase family protein n=1 Tax=Inquilinus sp. CAU 1745 TaxID=3140369 RepID=UPI00325B671E